jgi:GT2 family glycosyltransferase
LGGGLLHKLRGKPELRVIAGDSKQLSSLCRPVRAASVVLNYNSDADLRVSVPQLCNQQGIWHAVIIIDNASSPDCARRVQEWLSQEYPRAVVGSVAEVHDWVRANPEQTQVPGRVYLLLNPENRGYSAGNNIGIRLANELGAQAVLIANPDMRIENPRYVKELAEVLLAAQSNCIAASRIVGPDGADQSPLREPGFWEEFFWPRFYVARFLKPISYVLSIKGAQPVPVPKVSGCCLLLRMSFLQDTGLLDERVFLYCEEPILSAKVRQRGGRIVYAPALSAVHAHIKGEKGNASSRVLISIKSRKYYLERYSEYGFFKRWILSQSYFVLALVHRLKSSAAKRNIAS